MFSQLNLHKLSSTDKLSLWKTRFFDLTREYSSLPIEQGFLSQRRILCQTIKLWKPKCDICITKPVKGSRVVALVKQVYINKMEVILNYYSKIGPVDS